MSYLTRFVNGAIMAVPIGVTGLLMGGDARTVMFVAVVVGAYAEHETRIWIRQAREK